MCRLDFVTVGIGEKNSHCIDSDLLQKNRSVVSNFIRKIKAIKLYKKGQQSKRHGVQAPLADPFRRWSSTININC